jgi:glycosyltransferase involved in cell wall biosynthesis
MRIVYLHQYFVTPEMAGGVRSYEMARRLVALGHEVHMVTTDQKPARAPGAPFWRETVEAGIRVYWAAVPYDNTMTNAARVGAFLKFAWHAARKASSLKCDLIFATSTPLTIAIPALLARWRTRRPMVFEVRDLWPAVPIAMGALRNPLLKAAARWLERTTYRKSARVVALAPGMRDEIIATGYPADQVSVIPNGCDLATAADPQGGAELRRQNGWLSGRPALMFTGTFGLVNGMPYLVELAAEIAKLDPEIRVVALGTGREYPRVEALARERGVLDRSFFLMGQRTKREVAAWLGAADMTIALFTGPSIIWRDAVQNKFFDSLAAGKPVANNFPGWQSKVAAEAGAGLILSATDLPGAARDVVRALRDPVWMARASAAARELAHTRFDRDQLGAQLAQLLEAVHAADVRALRAP